MTDDLVLRGERENGRHATSFLDRDGLDADLARGADHAQRDLAAVGDQDILEQGGFTPGPGWDP